MSAFREKASAAEGPNLRFRLIQLEDAPYLHGLRTNPAYVTHLSKIQGDEDTQRAFLAAYKEREAKGIEYYYVMHRRDNDERCGVVRLYAIQ